MAAEALDCYNEEEKSRNPDYLSFDKAMIKAFARRIVGQIKEQMKLDNEQAVKCDIQKEIEIIAEARECGQKPGLQEERCTLKNL